jgi:hypothetical protein
MKTQIEVQGVSEAQAQNKMAEGIIKGDGLAGNEAFLQQGQQMPGQEPSQPEVQYSPQSTFSEDTHYATPDPGHSVVHTRMRFLKLVFSLWMVSHLIAVVSGYMLFSLRFYGIMSIVLHSLLAFGALVFVYGLFNHAAWARTFGIGYSAFVVVNAWANVVLNYIRFYDIIVFTDIITDVLLMLIFAIIGIGIYRNSDYFSGKGLLMFEKDPLARRRVAHILTCVLLSFGLAVYFYFVVIRL